jgi:hypothetical protein
LDVFEANSFQQIVDSGGSTYPWRVAVLDDNKHYKEFLVKLFTERQLSQQHAIAKELFGNILASQFELSVPKAGLVNFSDNFINTQLSDYEKDTLELKHKGLKFGCEWINGSYIADPNNLHTLFKDYDLATVFAFDNFVLNLDRGGFRDKPNLLLDDDDFYLIDHEQIFYFADNVDANFNPLITDFQNDIWNYQAEKHLLYPALKKLKSSSKTHIFDTFWTHLKDLNVDVLDETASFLTQNDISIGNYALIKEYLSAIKAQPDKFCKLLLQKIS